MPIQTAELQLVRSETITDAAANGGRMGAALVTPNLKNNVFPDVSQAERQIGLTRRRKLFVKAASADNLALLNARVHISAPTNGADRVTLAAGTQRDRQSDLANPREYGAARLKSDVAAGASSFIFLLEDLGQAIFQSGDTIWLGDASNREYHSNVTVAPNGLEVTVTLAAGEQLANAYAAAETYAASVLALGDLAPAADSLAIESTEGAYDLAQIALDSIGALEDDWTLTFQDSDTYTVAGAFTGALGSGSVLADYAPLNPTHGRPYFSLRAAGFSGGWTAGDTIRFSTHPAAAGIWLKHLVPTGCPACSADIFKILITGESA